MFSTPFSDKKLKVNLKLAVQRLKVAEKKKTEMALRSRKEIGDYLREKKVDRAKIRVEHIIREDYLVEALEIIEMNLDLVLARIQVMTNDKGKTPPPSLQPAIEGIIWAYPKIGQEYPDLKNVMDQFKLKYGKEYMNRIMNDDTNSNVHKKLKSRLDLVQPKDYIIEKYLEMIAQSYGVEYTPDQAVLDAWQREQDMLNEPTKPPPLENIQFIDPGMNQINPNVPGLPTMTSPYPLQPTMPAFTYNPNQHMPTGPAGPSGVAPNRSHNVSDEIYQQPDGEKDHNGIPFIDASSQEPSNESGPGISQVGMSSTYGQLPTDLQGLDQPTPQNNNNNTSNSKRKESEQPYYGQGPSTVLPPPNYSSLDGPTNNQLYDQANDVLDFELPDVPSNIGGGNNDNQGPPPASGGFDDDLEARFRNLRGL